VSPARARREHSEPAAGPATKAESAGEAGPGAPAKPRFPVVRKGRVQVRFRQGDRHRREALVPMVRRSGQWLAAAGFDKAQRLRIEAAPGRLTIEPAPA